MDFKKIQGFALNTPTGIASTDTTIQPDADKGKIVGLGVSENYADSVLGGVLASIQVGGNARLASVPLTAFKARGSNYYLPFEAPAQSKLSVNLNSLSGTPTAGNPIYLILYFENDKLI